jgi:hypothetical protein
MPRLPFRVRPILRLRLVLVALFLIAAAAVQAASTSFWQVATQAEFLKGDADRLSIDSDGRVTLGPGVETVHDVASPAVWRLMTDARDTLWAATGNDGKVWTVDRGGKAAVAFDAAELDVHALAPAPSGGVFAASSPDGKVYRLAADGQATPFFDPDDKYIWSLAPAPDGGLFVGTGEKGRIYKVGPDGRGTVFFEPETTHVMTLVPDGKGGLLVGTSSPGRVLRIDASGRAFVLLESSHKEIRGLRLAPDGVVYATAAGTSAAEAAPAKPAEPTSPTPIPTVTTEISVSAIGDSTIVTPATSGAVTDARPSGPQKGAVYRIKPDGEWSVVWESPEDLPYDVVVEPTGSLLVATGGKGKIFRLSGNPTLVTLVTKVDAQQVTAFGEDRSGRLLVATSNPGRILRVTAATAASGTYLSDVKDTATVATWGAIRWRATTPPGTTIEISTRSGNTRTPDKTWSDWSKPYAAALGSSIDSPKARYLQWRAVLAGSGKATPVLTSVSAAYLPRNTRPAVESITVHAAGVVFQRPFPTGDPELAGFDANTSDGRPALPSASANPNAPALGRRTYQKSLQTFVWQARDADGDRLQFDVFYRLEGDTTWTALKRGLADEIYTWDTTSVPDGTYILKVVATDAPANAPAAALSGERESATFDVDNTPATIEVSPARPAPDRLTFRVRDTQSALRSVEYSQNAGRWKLAYPVDGLLDSREERFELTLEPSTGGAVVLRVTDALGNVATAVVR